MADKTSTDLLLEILENTSKTLEYCKNIDFKYTILLSKLDSLDKKDIKIENKEQVLQEIKKPIENNKSVNVPVLADQTINSEGKNITVKQKVMYPDGKPAVLSKVELFDSEKKSIKVTRTAPNGSWNVLLPPGKYAVHVTKAPTTDKPKIDYYKEFVVTGNETSYIQMEDVK
jgi:hypothetical protein